MQLEMGISTRRYLPASGTAGLARSLVKGNSRVPCPPPMITESTLLVLTDWRPVYDIASSTSVLAPTFYIAPPAERAQAASALSGGGLSIHPLLQDLKQACDIIRPKRDVDQVSPGRSGGNADGRGVESLLAAREQRPG